MARIDEIRNERIKKLELLREKGHNPYPISARQDYTLADTKKNFTKLSKRKKSFFLVGRIIGMREHGGSLFLDLSDGTDKLQAYIKKNKIGSDLFTLFVDTVDIGDFLELGGTLFITKKKEKTLDVSSWRMLSKSIRPLPEKWQGLQDTEERFRKRYLDILSSDEIRERFLVRTQIIKIMRKILNDSSYLEVETPILQPIPGGATAEPFKTHHNALGIDLYLRIAPELYLKELLIAGIPRVYEIGRSFRNEGIDVTHNPEFTSVEAYASYSTPEKERKFIADLLGKIVKKVKNSGRLSYDGKQIDFSKPFKVVSYSKLLKQYALLKESELEDRETIALKARQFGINVLEYEGVEKILDNIFKKMCKPKLIQPTYIINYPIEFSPLSKKMEDSSHLVDRFQLVVGGLELVNGWAELNDPLEQKERFLNQEKKRKAGDKEAQIKDDAYVEALEYGMPPATGWGVGIERLTMLLTDTKNIREVILFPTLRPRQND